MDSNFEPNKNVVRSRNTPDSIPEIDEVFNEIEFVKVAENENLNLSNHEDEFNCN